MRKGRFSSPPADLALRYSESVSFDWRLYRHDIAGSVAHAGALSAAGVLNEDELRHITEGLRRIEMQIERDQFDWQVDLEDVHMNIESALTRDIGAAGAKLHTGRSRNDQVALDLRLYVREQITHISDRIRTLQRAIIDLAHRHRDVILPGYTHLQRAQPIPFGHYLLAQVEALARDADRFSDCWRRTNVMPLGSGALAGSSIVLDRNMIAKELGFEVLSQNSVDAVSDRDFACEFLFVVSLLGIHLSRLSEDLILWSSAEFRFVEFSDKFSTGSSLMPQKKNPDMAELTRGKSGRLVGNLVSLLVLLKGLPSSYNRDLQEDKRPIFDSADAVQSALEIFAAMLATLTVNGDVMAMAASDPNLLATDLAEYLVKQGLPFREAHEVVGGLVAEAAQARVPLPELSAKRFQEASPLFGAEVTKLFDVRAALARRQAVGAPSFENVASQIARWRQLLAE